MRNLLIFLILFPNLLFGQCIVINEIMINGGTCDGSCNPNTSEWVELYNTCNTDVDVGCYILADGDWTYVIPEGTTISSNGYLTIGGASQESTNPNLYWDNANGTTIGTFTNSAEQLALLNNLGNIVDGIVWGGGQDLQDNTNPVTTSGNCTVTNVSLPKENNSVWENIVTDGVNESTMARTSDGDVNWVNRTGTTMTFGTSNSGTPLHYVNTPITTPYTTSKDSTLTIIKIYTITGQEITNIVTPGMYIVTYSDYTKHRVVK